MSHLMLALLLTASQPLPVPTAQADGALVALVGSFVEAERAFDQAKIASLVTADYAEVSPLGDLDLHDAFLGFYAAGKKRPVPPMKLSEPLVRVHGDAASIIVRISFERPGPDGQPARAVTMRAGFLAVKSGGGWKLASAQYTPERPATPPPPAPPKP